MMNNKVAYNPKIHINKNIYLIREDDYIYKNPKSSQNPNPFQLWG